MSIILTVASELPKQELLLFAALLSKNMWYGSKDDELRAKVLSCVIWGAPEEDFDAVLDEHGPNGLYSLKYALEDVARESALLGLSKTAGRCLRSSIVLEAALRRMEQRIEEKKKNEAELEAQQLSEVEAPDDPLDDVFDPIPSDEPSSTERAKRMAEGEPLDVRKRKG